jgi:putative addiction module killer protein
MGYILMEPHPREVIHCVVGERDLFADWFENLRDFAARVAIRRRIDRVEEGNFGDHRYVGEGVWELRIHFGPGYRVYYGEDGPKIVLLLCGGDKRTQEKDIRRAQELWSAWRKI